MKQKEYQTLVEVYKILEYKDGCVYKTESQGHKFVKIGAIPPKGYQYISPSTKYKGDTYRTVDVDI